MLKIVRINALVFIDFILSELRYMAVEWIAPAEGRWCLAYQWTCLYLFPRPMGSMLLTIGFVKFCSDSHFQH